jgi:uncharacterized protein (TIGR02271 family)
MTFSAAPAGSNARTITAMFDNRTDAEEAVSRLVSLGLSRDQVRLVPGYENDSPAATDRSSEGFWDSLRDLFLPDEDQNTYAEGLRRGGFLVTASTNDALYEQALDILDDEGTINIDERADTWRSEGWTGQTTTSLGQASLQSPQQDVGMTSRETSQGLGSGASSADEVIPVVEENLRVGKRDVSHGRVRVRSYMVETPVSEQVSLREERVHVERRPVDRVLDATDRAFEERTIEAEERAEEAVVSKEARVTEELVIRKDVEQRTETVSDTVRHTEVEVEDERGTANATPRIDRTT